MTVVINSTHWNVKYLVVWTRVTPIMTAKLAMNIAYRVSLDSSSSLLHIDIKKHTELHEEKTNNRRSSITVKNESHFHILRIQQSFAVDERIDLRRTMRWVSSRMQLSYSRCFCDEAKYSSSVLDVKVLTSSTSVRYTSSRHSIDNFSLLLHFLHQYLLCDALFHLRFLTNFFSISRRG